MLCNDKRCGVSKLPETVFAENILSAYLGPREVSIFDVAASNENFRDYFLNCMEYTIFGHTINVGSDSQVSWLNKRHIGVCKVVVNIKSNGALKVSGFFSMVDFNYARLTHLSMSFSDRYFTKDKRIWSHIVSFCKKLQHLSFDNGSELSCRDFEELAESCPNMVSITMSNTILASGTVEKIIEGFRFLSELAIKDCHQNFFINSTSTPPLLISNSVRLLEISYSKLTDSGLILLGRKCPNLHTLHISQCYELNTFGHLDFPVAFPNLTCLNIFKLQVSDDFMKIVSSGLPRLKNLAIESSRLTNVGISTISQHLTHLVELTVLHAVELCDDNLLRLSNNCHNLKVLVLTECEIFSDNGILAIARGCPLLEEVEFSSPMISDIGVIPLIKSCSQLRNLNVSYSGITDQTLLTLSQYGNNVHTLTLTKCDGVTDVGLQHLSSRCFKIKNLDLSECLAITDTGIASVLRSNCFLSYLSLGFCSDITDVSLGHISTYCKIMKSLCLAGCTKLTDEGMRNIAANCKNLEILNLSQCIKLSDDIILHIIIKCYNLLVLNISGFKLRSFRSIRGVKRSQLDVIYK